MPAFVCAPSTVRAPATLALPFITTSVSFVWTPVTVRVPPTAVLPEAPTVNALVLVHPEPVQRKVSFAPEPAATELLSLPSTYPIVAACDALVGVGTTTKSVKVFTPAMVWAPLVRTTDESTVTASPARAIPLPGFTASAAAPPPVKPSPAAEAATRMSPPLTSRPAPVKSVGFTENVSPAKLMPSPAA